MSLSWEFLVSSPCALHVGPPGGARITGIGEAVLRECAKAFPTDFSATTPLICFRMEQTRFLLIFEGLHEHRTDQRLPKQRGLRRRRPQQRDARGSAAACAWHGLSFVARPARGARLRRGARHARHAPAAMYGVWPLGRHASLVGRVPGLPDASWASGPRGRARGGGGHEGLCLWIGRPHFTARVSPVRGAPPSRWPWGWWVLLASWLSA